MSKGYVCTHRRASDRLQKQLLLLQIMCKQLIQVPSPGIRLFDRSCSIQWQCAFFSFSCCCPSGSCFKSRKPENVKGRNASQYGHSQLLPSLRSSGALKAMAIYYLLKRGQPHLHACVDKHKCTHAHTCSMHEHPHTYTHKHTCSHKRRMRMGRKESICTQRCTQKAQACTCTTAHHTRSCIFFEVRVQHPPRVRPRRSHAPAPDALSALWQSWKAKGRKHPAPGACEGARAPCQPPATSVCSDHCCKGVTTVAKT